MRNFYDKISYILEEIIKNEFKVQLEPPLWEVPQRQEFGDLSTMVALKLSSKLKQGPLELAPQIKTFLAKRLGGEIEKIEILKPGFINIFLSQKILVESLNEILRKKESFFKPHFKRKILIEFLSANPTGPLSIAHGRQAVVGDTIANILEFCGNRVEREYYLNDAGKQIDLFCESTAAALQALKEDRQYLAPEGGYQGEYITGIARQYLAEGKKMNIGDFGIASMLRKIKKDMGALGVEKFHRWFSQKKLIEENKVDETIELLQRRRLNYEKQGALWFTAAKFGDKAERKYDQLINLWGPDHHGYIKRVTAALQALGYRQNLLRVVIVQLVSLTTKERMSKRAGTFVLLADLIKDVGKDAARFYYLTRKNSSHLEFDIALAKKASFDNPLYYIQYVCARIESIFRKAKGLGYNTRHSRKLTTPEELTLLRILLQFSYCLEKAYFSLEPVFVIEFLKTLASSFHKFYERVRVLDEDTAVTQARLNLLYAVRIVLHCGLKLLGITPVKKM